VLGGVPRLQRFARLAAIETALGREPNAMLRLAALGVFVQDDAPRLAARFRLSNAEQSTLALGAADHARNELPDETWAKRSLYELGPGDYDTHVLLAWADSGDSPDDKRWRSVLALPERWQAPAFPLRGADIIALGNVKGPEIGEILRRLEAEWIAGGFAEDRDRLMAKAAALASQAGHAKD
jgi:tRNA nucleotidyltransferase/poly(A) polymerase